MTVHEYESAPSPRNAPESLKILPPKEEGAGNAGCLLHPRSRVQSAQRKTHTSIQVQRRQSDIPCAMVLRLIARSPRRRIPFATVIDELAILSNPVGLAKTSADLAPATGARTTRFRRTPQRRSSDATSLRSRVQRTRPATMIAPDAAASTASLPNVRDDHDTPLFGSGRRQL